MADKTYVVTASNPDGTPYTDALGKHAVVTGGAAAYGDADRDERVAAIEAAGLTPHVRPA
ncbi:hypothetical protein RVR_5804 [Actinacidiphila reveromycinica]|uniref:Uncharacterized protein n=1 Tax=Actinacidiphila reveromycinica TaxID=659352 RepID=A0A7U3UUU6_9ACTN|nr:hypothetical protein [Streptomyces sp. SN-593]BBA99262.1 hypothetical protein RVR_5804 [Streptomyces sp. SN-593]